MSKLHFRHRLPPSRPGIKLREYLCVTGFHTSALTQDTTLRVVPSAVTFPEFLCGLLRLLVSPEDAETGRRPAKLFNVNARRASRAQWQADLSPAEIMPG